MPKEVIDRNSEQDARRELERLAEDPSIRKVVFARMLDSIRMCDRINPRSWAVTLRPNTSDVSICIARLNVGSIEAIVLNPHMVRMVVDRRSLDAETIASIQIDYEDYAKRRECDPIRVVIPATTVEGLEREFGRLGDAHRTLLKEAARHNTPYARSHSPGVVRFLNAYQ